MKYLLTERGWKHEPVSDDRMDWGLEDEIIFLLVPYSFSTKPRRKKEGPVGATPSQIARKVWLHGKIKKVSPEIVKRKLNQLVTRGLVTTV